MNMNTDRGNGRNAGEGTAAPGAGEGVLVGDGPSILGASASMRRAVDRALRVAGTDASVFLVGESGTGKELFARLIHEKSRRSGGALVPVNCAALPADLLESELFGHRRGAFTDAVRNKAGLLETAHGGTLFLDELTEMDRGLQAKLLRVIQDGVVRRVGSEETDAVVDVRFITATSRDPRRAVREGLLREDVYYRLRVVGIRLAPLRERPEDIPVLSRHFLARSWRRHRREDGPPPRLRADALSALVQHPWPGNVRELQNVIEQTAIFAGPGEIVGPGRLPPLAGEPAGGNGAHPVTRMNGVRPKTTEETRERSPAPYHAAKKRIIDRFEREYLTRVVLRTEGNLSEAARRSGVDRATLYRLMDKHELSRDALMA